MLTMTLCHEEFIGLYSSSGTTGQGIAKMVTDVLLRLNLPMSALREQSYDSASNMADQFSYTGWLLSLPNDPGLPFLGPSVRHPFQPVRKM